MTVVKLVKRCITILFPLDLLDVDTASSNSVSESTEDATSIRFNGVLVRAMYLKRIIH